MLIQFYTPLAYCIKRQTQILEYMPSYPKIKTKIRVYRRAKSIETENGAQAIAQEENRAVTAGEQPRINYLTNFDDKLYCEYQTGILAVRIENVRLME
jgi:hypothetical protein